MKKHALIFIVIGALLLISSLTLAANSYTVKTGDTLWKISQKTGVSIEKIIELNKLNNPNNVYVGQKLIINEENSNGNNNSNDNNGNRIHYTVNPGDLLWKIAQRYNVSAEKIISLNNIKSPYYIYIGQTLLIPGVKDSQPAETQNSYFYYTVQPGDILWNIAQKYDTTVKRLVELNDIKNAYDLYAGRKLIVPLKNSQPAGDTNNNGNNNSGNNNNNNSNPNRGTYVPYFFYKIKEGDRIWNIADYFGIKTSTLIRFNNIEDINNVQAGNVLIIPLQESTKLNYLKRASRQLNNYYRVLNNETLSDIAEYYNIPEEGIRAINHLNADDEVYTGQRLLMPVNPALFIKHEIYRVKSGGEYIFDIAYNNGISIKSILKANYLKNQNTRFKEGTIILIPKDSGSKATWIDYENGEPVNSWF